MTVGRARTSPRQRTPSPRRGHLGTQGARAQIIGLAPTAWYDSKDLLAGTQTWASRVVAASAQLGATSGVDATDPTIVIAARNYLDLDGSDDYIQLDAALTPTFTATTGKLTVVICLAAPANTLSETIYSAGSSTADGAYLFLSNAGVLTARVGVTGPTNVNALVGTGLDDGTTRVVAGIWNEGSVTAWEAVAGAGTPASYAAIGTIAFQTPRIGVRASGTALPSNHNIYSILIFDGQALTTTQLSTVATILLAGVYL